MIRTTKRLRALEATASVMTRREEALESQKRPTIRPLKLVRLEFLSLPEIQISGTNDPNYQTLAGIGGDCFGDDKKGGGGGKPKAPENQAAKAGLLYRTPTASNRGSQALTIRTTRHSRALVATSVSATTRRSEVAKEHKFAFSLTRFSLPLTRFAPL